MTTTDEFIVATPRMAAGLLIRDAAGQVLLVKPTYKKGWDIPGGYVEPGESPLSACRREVREELGIEVTPTSLLVVDWAPHPAEGDKLLWVFHGGTLAAEALDCARLQSSEIAEARFWASDSFEELMPDRLSRRLHAAISAIEQGTVAYLENGAAAFDQAAK